MVRQEVINQRREQVKSLMLARISIKSIAKQLNWNPDTIFEDIKSIRREYQTKELQEGDLFVDFLMRNEKQYQNANQIFMTAGSADDKLRANAQMRETDRARLDMCQEFGITQKQLGNLNVREIKLVFGMDIEKEI